MSDSESEYEHDEDFYEEGDGDYQGEEIDEEYEDDTNVKAAGRTRRVVSDESDGDLKRGLDVNAPLGDDDEEDEPSTDANRRKRQKRSKKAKKAGDSGDVSVKKGKGHKSLSIKFRFSDKKHKKHFNELTSSPSAGNSLEPSRESSPTKARSIRRGGKVNYNEEGEDEFDDEDEEDGSEEYVALQKTDPSRMTERQREKFFSTSVSASVSASGSASEDSEMPPPALKKGKGKSKELLSLMDKPARNTKSLSEDEIQLRREEQARKRKNFSLKKLEAEKRDTLNKLLMKRADKVRDLDKLKGKEYGDEEEKQEEARRPQLKHNALFRWTSKTENGSNVSYYSLHT